MKQEKNKIIAVSVLAIAGLGVGFAASTAFTAKEVAEGRWNSVPANVKERWDEDKVKVVEENEKLRAELASLREDIGELQTAASTQDTVSEQLNNSLQDAKEFAGLTELVGPGIIVTLRDSVKSAEEIMDPLGGIIHDRDVLAVLNELWNAGAEAISINGKRVGPRTSVRCVGSTVDVDSQRFASPIVIRAIGDQQTLFAGVNLREGVLDEIRQLDQEMVSVERVKKIRVPAFDGVTESRVAKVPEAE